MMVPLKINFEDLHNSLDFSEAFTTIEVVYSISDNTWTISNYDSYYQEVLTKQVTRGLSDKDMSVLCGG